MFNRKVIDVMFCYRCSFNNGARSLHGHEIRKLTELTPSTVTVALEVIYDNLKKSNPDKLDLSRPVLTSLTKLDKR